MYLNIYFTGPGGSEFRVTFRVERSRRTRCYAYRAFEPYVRVAASPWPSLSDGVLSQLLQRGRGLSRWYATWNTFIEAMRWEIQQAVQRAVQHGSLLQLAADPNYSEPPVVVRPSHLTLLSRRGGNPAALECDASITPDHYARMSRFIRDARVGCLTATATTDPSVSRPRRRFAPRQTRRGVVRGYTFRPTPALHRTSSETVQAREYLGVEIEVDASERPDSSTRNDIARIATEHLGSAVYTKEDGSLDFGAEIVSHPGTLAWWNEQRPAVDAMMQTLVQAGWRSHNTRTAGLHVHVSRTAFDSATHLYRWLHLIYRNQAMTLYVSQRAPELLDRWASLSHNARVNLKTKAGLERSTSYGSRYEAVNATENTMEVRIFRGTLLPSRFFKALQFVSGSIAFTRETTSLRSCSAKKFKAWVDAHAETYPDLAAFLNESCSWLAQSRTDTVVRSYTGRRGLDSINQRVHLPGIELVPDPVPTTPSPEEVESVIQQYMTEPTFFTNPRAFCMSAVAQGIFYRANASTVAAAIRNVIARLREHADSLLLFSSSIDPELRAAREAVPDSWLPEFGCACAECVEDGNRIAALARAVSRVSHHPYMHNVCSSPVTTFTTTDVNPEVSF